MKSNIGMHMVQSVESRKRVVTKSVFIWLSLLLIVVFKSGFASVLSDLAATVEPGEFVELEIDGAVSTCQALMPVIPERHPAACRRDANGNVIDEDGKIVPNPDPRGCLVPIPSNPGNILEFTDKALWDPIGREVYVLGTRRPYKPWDQGFVKYSEATNSWIIEENPPFGFGPHGYDHVAMDVVGRNLYLPKIDVARIVWTMDMDTGIWRRIPNSPSQAGQFTAMDFFPELDRLVFFNGLGGAEYALYDSVTELWEGPFSLADTPFGAVSHFSEYNPIHNIMFYGGGYNDSSGANINVQRRFYMLDENRVAHKLADPPTFLGQFGAGPIQTIDPNTGNLVVFQGKPNEGSAATCPSPGPLPIWEYDFDSNTWNQTGTQTLTRLWCDMDTVAVPLYEYGVNFIVSFKSRNNCKVYLYRHSPTDPAPPSIITHPAPQSAEEGSTATFNIAISGSGPLEYKWYRDDVLIVGETNSSYTTEAVTVADQGAEYNSIVTNSLGQAVSDYATLSVLMDTTAPLISGVSVRDLNSVDVQFSEVISAVSAQLVGNYQISDGIQVIAANLNPDGKTVRLQIDDLITDNVYTLTISNIQDVSAATNTIIPGSSVDIVFAPVMNFDDGSLPFGWEPLTESRWSVVEESGNNVLFLNTTNYDAMSGLRLGEHIISADNYGDFTLMVEAKTNEDSSNGNADYALIFGFEDGENYFYMLFNRTQSNTQLFKVENGIRQELGTATASIAGDQYHTVEVRRTTDNVEVRFDGSIVLDIIDSSFPSGKLGLGSFNDSAYFDNIRITGSVGIFDDLIFYNAFEN